MGTKTRRAIKVLGFGLGSLLLLVALLYLFRLPLFGRLIAERIEEGLGEALGGRFTVGGIEGSLVSDITVLDLATVDAPSEGSVRGLAFDRARVEYDLLGLIFGDAPAESIRRIEVFGADLRLHAEGGEDDASLPSLASTPLDASLPIVRIAGRLELQLGGQPFRAEDILIETRSPDVVALKVAAVHAGDEAVKGSLEGELERVSPTTLEWTSASRLGGLGLPEATYQTSGRVQARIETGGGALELVVSPTEAEAATPALDLAGLPDWVGRLLPESTPLPTRGTLVGSFQASEKDALRIEADAEIRDLLWRDVEARRIRVVAHTDESGVIRLDRVDAEIGGAVLRIREGHLDPTHPYWIRSAATIEADVPDLSAILPDYGRATAIGLRARKDEGARLEITRLDIVDPLFRGGASGWVDLPAKPEDVDEARVRLELEGALPDLGLLGVPELSGTLGLEGLVEGTRAALAWRVARTGGSAAVHGQALDSLEARGSLQELRFAHIETARLSSAGTIAEVSGSADLSAPDLELEAELDVGDLRAWLPEGTASGAARLGVAVVGAPKDLRANGRFEASDLLVAGIEIESARGDLVMSAGRIHVRGLEAVLDEVRVVLEAGIDLETSRARIETLEAERRDGTRLALQEPLEVEYREGVVRVPGVRAQLDDLALVADDLEVEVEAGRARLGSLRATLEGTEVALEAPLLVTWRDDVVETEDVRLTVSPDARVRASLRADLGAERVEVRSLEAIQGDLEARLVAPLVITMPGERVQLNGLAAQVDTWRVDADLSLLADARRIDVEALRARGGDLEVALAAPAVVTWDDEGVEARDLAIDALGGRVAGDAAWHGGLRARLEARGLDLAPYLDGVEGRADAELEVKGDTGVLAVRVPRIEYAGEVVALEGVVVQEAEGGLRIRDLRLYDERGSELAGEATLPWRLEAGGLTQRPDVVPSLSLSGQLPALSRFSERLRSGPVRVEVTGDATGLRGVLRIPDLLLGEEGGPRDDAEVAFELTDASGRTSVRLLDADIVRVEGRASVGAGVDWHDPQALGRLLDAPLEGELTAEVHEWERLRPLLGDVRQVAGRARGDLRVRGTLRAPDFEGALSTQGVRIEISSAIPTVSSLDARLAWRDGRVSIERLDGELGFAPFEISGHVDAPLDAAPIFDLKLRGKHVLAARSDAMRLRTDVDLSVQGPLDALVTSGALRITSLLYVKPVSMSGNGPDIPPMGFRLFSIEEGPLSTMRFDVKIEADETIRVRNNLARGRMSADLVLRGTGKKPEPEGRIVAREASIFLPVTTLHLRGAEVEFPPGDPFGPRVRATARSRASGYELGVRITGRIPDLDVVVYSRPRLSDEDAMLLLATGATAGAAGSSGVQSVTFQKIVEFFGKNLFSYARATADPDARPFFDRFSLTVGRERSRRGNETVETELGLTEKIYLTLDRDRYDETNLGFIWRLRLP